MKLNPIQLLGFIGAFAALAPAQAQLTTVDGIRGIEWSGITPDHIPYSSTNSAFQFVGYSEFVPIDVYFRSDATYLYALLEAKPLGLGLDQWSTGLDFANVYFNTDNTGGSDLGFELQNDRAFVPNQAPYYGPLSSFGVKSAVSVGLNYGAVGGPVGSIIEFAVPWTFFRDNPLSIPFSGLNPTTPTVQFRSLQAFGYTFIGANSFGDDRFGQAPVPSALVPVPEPSTYAIFSMLALLGVVARRHLRSRRARP